MSLQSASSFIATININDSSLWGIWQISVPTSYFYSITVSATSDLRFSSDLLEPDPFSVYGFSSVVGKPLSGMPSIHSITYCRQLTKLSLSLQANLC